MSFFIGDSHIIINQDAIKARMAKMQACVNSCKKENQKGLHNSIESVPLGMND